MLFRIIATATALSVALLALAMYCPLVDQIEDPYRARLVIGVYRLAMVVPFQIGDWLGYGSFFDNIVWFERYTKPNLNAPPNSASYGIMEVSRGNIAGVNVIIYRPKSTPHQELLPGLIFLHGGGWVHSNPDEYDRTVHDVTNCTRKITISVDYRLAPTHPFPASVQDCLAVTRHVLEHGKALGIDVKRVGIAGDSAGGNMAAAVALRLLSEKKSGLPSLKYQALLYPALQALDLQLPSFVEIGDRVPAPTSYRMAGYWAMYMGLDRSKINEYGRLIERNLHVSPHFLQNSQYAKYIDRQNLPERFRKPRPEVMGQPIEQSIKEPAYDAVLFAQIQEKLTDPLMCPLMSPDLHGLPPTLVLVAEFDVLRDDGLLYAHRLRKAGVETDVYIGKGHHLDFFHIFPDFLHSRTGRKSLNALCNFIHKVA